MSYWRTREITQRLQDARRTRTGDNAAYEAFEAMMDQLPQSIVMAIFAHLNGEQLLTLTPREDWE